MKSSIGSALTIRESGSSLLMDEQLRWRRLGPPALAVWFGQLSYAGVSCDDCGSALSAGSLALIGSSGETAVCLCGACAPLDLLDSVGALHKRLVFAALQSLAAEAAFG